MPNKLLNLQLFGDEGMADGALASSDVAENPVGDGVATETTGDQVATGEESWDSLIKGRFKEDYEQSIKDAIGKRLKNQRDLQGQINSIDPMIRALAQRYEIQADANGNIPIDALTSKVLDDNSIYEEEAFQRGMSVEDLKQIKSLERENAQLKAAQHQTEEQREWQSMMQEGQRIREMYPDFDLETEMNNPNFGRLLAQMQRSGFPNAMQVAYEVCHKDEIMGGAMRYAVQQTQQKISNSIQSGMSRPVENGTSNRASANPGAVDPSKFTKAQIEEMKMRAARGERITF